MLGGILKHFTKSFPTATIIYILLVLFTNLQFEWSWLVFAFVIDVIDDVLQQAPI